jgi:hypothetical protein
VSESTPPTVGGTDEAAGEISLAARILLLQEQHQSLGQQIEELYEYPYLDQLLLQRLKKKKLGIKDAITRYKGDLIPDLNA